MNGSCGDNLGKEKQYSRRIFRKLHFRMQDTIPTFVFWGPPFRNF